MMRYSNHNQIALLENGADYFPALISAIADASHEIYLQTYIYALDSTGLRVGEALKQAAQRGVRVHMLLDGFGCKDLDKNFVQELEQAGIALMFYRPKISPWTFKKSRLRRLHRKVSVIDRKTAFVGGINIIDDYNTPEQMPPRIDYAVRVTGPLVHDIGVNVRRLWRRISWAHFKRHDQQHIAQLTAGGESPGVKAAFVVRDNVLHRRDIERAYLNAIAHAKSEIIIANAYFIPGRRFRQALLHAARRGVTVKLLLQGHKEYFLMFATHAFYSVFLANNIQIYEYSKSFMHSKVAVIDGHWATVGSSNIDPFSLLLGHEANVVVQNTDFAHSLRASLLQAIHEGASPISAESWAHSHIAKRLASWLAYGLVRLLVGLIGYADEKP